MMSTLDGWLPILLAWAWKSSLLLLIAYGVTRSMRRSSAAARHLVWSAALGGVALLPLLTAVVPVLSVPVLPALGRGTELPPMEQAVGGSALAASEARAVEQPAVTAEPGAMLSASVPKREEASGTRGRGGWDWIAGLWALGAALILLRMIAGVLHIRQLRRQSSVLTDRQWLNLAHELGRRLGLARSVTLLRGGRGMVPMTWGVRQPMIWLPAAAEAWSSERRAVVLAHELAHVRRFDALTQWVAHLAVALCWFNPLVWKAARRLREERERACDDMVLALGTQPSTYAEHLLNIARSSSGAAGPVAAMAMARRSQLEGRLLAILDGELRRSGVSRRAVAGVVGLATLLLLPVACLRAAPASAAGVRGEVAAVPPSAPEAQQQAEQIGDPFGLAKAADTLPQAAPALPQKPWSTVIRLNGSHNGEPSFRLVVEAEGVILAPEREAVAGLRPGGSLVITQELLPGYPDPDPLRPVGSGETLVRTLRAVRGPEGQAQYFYAVNGQPREFGREGRAWLTRILRENLQR
ncbi:MAG TPA: M56 family metallopeptidase [Longimicrobiaceae bacterium]|nr:M56 family metallopeptidase [Longimicrobiaceae bacterium]